MADALISAVVEKAVSFLAQEIEENIQLVVGAQKDVKKLYRKLVTIQAVLNDAEKKQMKDESVRVWLAKLKDVSYDAEDVLDEWNTAILKAQKENTIAGGSRSNKVCSCFPSPRFCFSQIFLRHNIGSKIKDITETLGEIANEQKQFGFSLNGSTVDPVRLKTTSLIDVMEICGRKLEKETIVNKLLCESSQGERGLHIISIVGFGGIGKTTLAQLAYNDDEVKAHFDKRIWVCVSDPFDQMSIARSILEALDGSVQNFLELEIPLQKIQDSIKKHKLLLVLDDVWTTDNKEWEPLKLSLKCCGQESRILVTTRDERVAKMMDTTEMLHLEKLSEEESWLLFKQIAFSGKDEDESKNLEDTGMKIAKKCEGLPLAIKTLGSLMRFKEKKQDWENVLNSETWELEEVERGLFPPLLLSYYDLPSPVKRCFSYCAIFPKDFRFEKDDLIKLWMAQDFLNPKGNIDMEKKGEEYFNNLVVRSFFQEFEKDYFDGSIISCKMHDIVHDFAQFLMKNEPFIVKNSHHERELRMGSPFSKVRHSTIILDLLTNIPPSLYEAKNLRTLMLSLPTNMEGPIPSISFDCFKCLRILKFSGFRMAEVLPSSIGKLVHLRYLEISRNRGLMELPETLCDLYNLQTLNLGYGGVRKLPQGMRRLINLRHLVWTGDGFCLPKGIGEMRSLRTLSKFLACDEEGCCKLGELKNLNHLEGSLCLDGLGNVTNVEDAAEAKLHEKGRLLCLELNNRGKEVKEGVIEALHPHPGLERLTITWLSTFPNWMFSLPNLRYLKLELCGSKHLPPLGKLPSLETLNIQFLSLLESVGDEFLGLGMNDDEVIVFPKLKHLYFETLFSWEKWVDPTKKRQGEEEEEEDSSITIMPNLLSLVIRDCNRLEALPHYILKTRLRELIIDRCLKLGFRYKEDGGRDWNKISHIPKLSISVPGVVYYTSSD